MAKRALDEPATQRAWVRARRRSRVVLILWTLTLPAYAALGATIEMSGGSFPSALMGIPATLSLVGIAISGKRWEHLKDIRRLLGVYTWQAQPLAPAPVENGETRFRLPNPDDGGKAVNVSIRGRLNQRRWRRALRENTGEFWFAGDPRFSVVIATPGPGELLLVQEGRGWDYDSARPPKGVSDQSWQLARAAENRAAPTG